MLCQSLSLVCGLKHAFVSTENHVQSFVHIFKSYFSFVDHVILICVEKSIEV